MRILLTELLLILFSKSFAIDFSNLNTRYWYDPGAPVSLKSRVASHNDEITVFYKLNSENASKISVEYLLQDDYDEPNDQILGIYSLDTIGTEESNVLRLRFSTDLQILVLKVYDGSNYFYFPVQLKRGGLDHPPFYPVDREGFPIIDSYVSDEEFGISSLTMTDRYYLYRYKEAFPPADPPTGNTQRVNPTLEVDSLLSVSSGATIFPDISHFYFVQTDTLSTDGFTLYAGPSYYPEYRDIDLIIPPVTYFSKTSEMGSILNAKDKKVAFDRFWLTLYNTKNTARSAIASYYRKVWAANDMFTDYKAGWKTDRGIIYLIFGNPVEVYRQNKREYWTYSNIQFEFRIISNLFAPNLYILIRDEDYETKWLEQLNLLRGGK